MSVNNNVMNHLSYGLFSDAARWSTIRCLKAFRDDPWANKLQFLNEYLTAYKDLLTKDCKNDTEVNTQLEEYYKQLIQSIPNSIYYHDFSQKVLPTTSFFNELKDILPKGVRLLVANKIEGSIWNDRTEKRQRHDVCVIRLHDTKSTAVLDFKHPEPGEEFIQFYKFELQKQRQSKGIGKQVFPVLCKLLTAPSSARNLKGLESPVLETWEQQPVFDDHRDNWRFQPAASGESKLYEWWTKRGGIAIDRDDTNRLYFMRFKYACDWITANPEHAQQTRASFAAPIYGEQQQATLNDLITAVSVAA